MIDKYSSGTYNQIKEYSLLLCIGVVSYNEYFPQYLLQERMKWQALHV
ncbi:hypothetical protein ANACOL_04342 [Anaerotruncus colihominis DSM 17241]|uniref:Uncharacterized protein n=1 Tax=Anaerotruncus colihominis DSM 17241 TaxID=445972 RepID=B0PHP9_9FIRM|nr:hypothetical protein ANACOL_04342 [Anaerotruncus colihominis DSM 17241]